MKKSLKITALLLLLSIAVLALASCSKDEGEKTNGKALTLNVYNWGEYISDGSLGSYDTIAEFEAWYLETYGQKVVVNYSTYPTCEDMYSKIVSGAGSYDVIIPSDYMIEKMIAEDLLIALDHEKIPNFANIDEAFTGENNYYDPNDVYTVPYSYGKVGVIYNTAFVAPEDAEAQSWSLLFNEKYKGKILQFNNPRDGMAVAMYANGLNVNSDKTEDWDKCLEYLKAQKPLIQGYVSDEIFNKMVTASAWIATYYAGDYITMADKNEDLAFYYPVEGTNLFVDAMCIPKCAKNVDLAHAFINFMLSEDAAVANAEYIGYASPNKLVKENADYREEMGEEAIEILYSEEDVNKNYPFTPNYHNFSPEMQNYTNALWEELKTESSTELWVHITSATILLLVGGGAGYTVYLRKKRSRVYRLRDREKAKERALAAKNKA